MDVAGDASREACEVLFQKISEALIRRKNEGREV